MIVDNIIKKIMTIFSIVFLVNLTSCSNNIGSNTQTSQLKFSNSAEIPVIDGNPTNTVIYINNTSDHPITDISFSVEQDRFSNNQLEIITNQCKTIDANTSCGIRVKTPTLAYDGGGSSIIHAYYTNSGELVDIKTMVNYQYYSSKDLANKIAFSRFNDGINNEFFTVYLYAIGQTPTRYNDIHIDYNQSQIEQIAISNSYFNMNNNQVIAIEYKTKTNNLNDITLTPSYQIGKQHLLADSLTLRIIPVVQANLVLSNINSFIVPTAITQTVMVLNKGNANASNIQIMPSNNITISNNTCQNIVLLPNQSCSYNIGTNSANSGIATVNISANGINNVLQNILLVNRTDQTAIIGISANTPIIQLGPYESRVFNVKLTNINRAPLVSSNIFITTTGNYTVNYNASSCNINLAAGNDCSFDVTIQAGGNFENGMIIIKLLGQDLYGNSYIFGNYLPYTNPILPINTNQFGAVFKNLVTFESIGYLLATQMPSIHDMVASPIATESNIIYMVGSTSTPLPGMTQSNTGTGAIDAFFIKYNRITGQIIKTIEFGSGTNIDGNNTTIATGIAINSVGDIYITGISESAVKFNGLNLKRVNSQGNDGFLIKLNNNFVTDSSSSIEFGAKESYSYLSIGDDAFGGSVNLGISVEASKPIAIDSLNNVYIVGGVSVGALESNSIKSPRQFRYVNNSGGGSLTNSTLYTTTKTSNLGVDSSYILKYTKTLTLPTIGAFGRVFNTNIVTSSNQLNDILVDNSNTIYAVGRTFAKLDGVNNTLQKINATGYSDGFLLRYIYQSNSYVESNSIEFGGFTTNQPRSTTAMRLSSNPNNQVYYSGWTNISLIRPNTIGNFAYVRTYTNSITTYEYADNFILPNSLQYNKLGNTFYNLINAGSTYATLGESRVNTGYDGFIQWIK